MTFDVGEKGCLSERPVKDLTSGHTVLPGLELYLRFQLELLFELAAV